MGVTMIGRTHVLTVAAHRARRELYHARYAEGYALYREEMTNPARQADPSRSANSLRRAQRRLALRHREQYRALYERWRDELGWTAAPPGRTRDWSQLRGGQ